MEKFIVIDGNSLINRAFYALPLLTNSQGEYSNAVYGFCNMLVKAIKEYNPKYIAVAFDRKEPTFRHKMYKGYKGTRKGMPEELAEQMPILKEVLTAMNVRIIEKAGIEADDIIGIISKRFKEHTIILTGDKDNLQLIDDTTDVWLTRKGLSNLEKIDTKTLKEEFNLEPYQVIEMKALMGDSSDNIPGVPGVGQVTAQKLIDQYKNLDAVYENIEDQKGKLKERLIENKELAYLSRELATIATDRELDIKLTECTYDFPFNQNVYDLFRRYEFKSLLKREDLFEELSSYNAEVEVKTVIKEVNTLEELKKLVEEIDKVTEFSFHITKNVHIAISKFEEYVIKLRENLLDTGLDFNSVLYELKDVLASENIKKILFNFKNTKHFLVNNGFELNGVSFDIELAEYLVNGSKKVSGNMLEYLNKYNYPETSIASCFLNAKNKLNKALTEHGMKDLYYNIEFALIDVLYNMEKTGFKIDMEVLNELNFRFENELKDLTKKIHDFAGEQFNINSPKQLGEILFEKLQLPTKNNKKKSTSVSVLEKLVDYHPIIELIMRYRHLAKLNGTYLEGFKDLIDKKTHLVHTVFNQTVTATGRLSSTEPNLQNIPIRTADGRELRKMFVTRFDGGKLIAADYSQIELRLMAHYSEDPNLIQAYVEGKDIHAKTASDIFSIPESEVTSNQRRDAKAVNFGIIYGISDYGLSQNIGSSRLKAKDYIDKYFEKYPGVKAFMERAVEDAKKTGFVTTLMHRKRFITNINASNYMVRQGAERAAMNMPLQGSASDIIKLAMVHVYNKLNKLNLRAKLILQIHDELIIDCPKEELETVKQILKSEMELVAKLKVPLVVDMNTGDSWFEAK